MDNKKTNSLKLSNLEFKLMYVYNDESVLFSRAYDVRPTEIRNAFVVFFNAIDMLKDLPCPDLSELHLLLCEGASSRSVMIAYPTPYPKVFNIDSFTYIAPYNE